MPDIKLFVSIIIPCRNEIKYIRGILDDIENQNIDKSIIEVIIADGLSDDGTREVIGEYCQRLQYCVMLDNINKTVPYALNMAITYSKGTVILRMDAHARYQSDYVSKLVKHLLELNADNVGGVWDTQPGDDTLMAKAIAIGSSHSIGIGNAHYKTGTLEIKNVDTVPFGCYKRDVFDRIGLFDVELTRNQDDEFNGRLIKSGGRIFLVPDVSIKYFARKTLSKLSTTYYQYGYFKPLVNLKLGMPATWRQLAPPTLLVAVIVLIVAIFVFHSGVFLFLFFIIGYISCITFAAIHAAIRSKNISLTPLIVFVFVTLHYSYGMGYLKGLIDFYILNKRTTDTKLTR